MSARGQSQEQVLDDFELFEQTYAEVLRGI